MELDFIREKDDNVTGEKNDLSFIPSANESSEILWAFSLFEAHFSDKNWDLCFVDILKI